MKTKTESELSPTPWQLKWDTVKQSWLIYHSENDAGPFIRIRSKVDAEFIVRAVNSHEVLLAVVKRYIKAMEQKSYPELQGITEEMYQARDKAEGK